MANAVVAYNNVAFRAGAAVTATSEVSTLPASNLANRTPAVIWRSSATTVSIDVDAGAATAIGWVGLFGVDNVLTSDSMQIKLGTTQGDNSVHDSGSIAADVSTVHRQLRYLVGSADVSARWCRLTLTCASAPEAGVIVVAPTLRPARNVQWPIAVRYLPTAILSATIGRQVVGRAGPEQRELTAQWRLLTAAEALTAALQGIARLAGTGAPLVVDAAPHLAGEQRHAHMIYGDALDAAGVNWASLNDRQLSLRVIEAL